ncbi:MAG: hypothetical protein NC390_05885 [Fusobacterium sp.]|nr:hypothetical protein [Fusobacterium sp.]
MLEINQFNTNIIPRSISFGSTERSTGRKLHSSCVSLANCDYFIRNNETPPNEIGDFLIYHARKANEVEMKIWGCSDLSSFVSRKLAMINTVGEDEFRKLFGRIELIDIDESIINRAKKGLIGVVSNEFTEFNKTLGFKLQDYLTPVQDKSKFFLDGEPDVLPTSIYGDFQKIAPYKLSDVVMNDLDIHVGDIREDLKNMPKPRDGVKRIFEFANGWYFMPPKEHVKLASRMSEKMQASDIMIVGNCELRHGVPELLSNFGFRQLLHFPEAFQKVEDLNLVKLKFIETVMNKVYKGKFL